MKDPTAWRIAILDRAVALQQNAGAVAREFLAIMHDKPPSITREEAGELAKEFPFSQTQIYRWFQIKED